MMNQKGSKTFAFLSRVLDLDNHLFLFKFTFSELILESLFFILLEKVVNKIFNVLSLKLIDNKLQKFLINLLTNYRS